MDKVRDQDRGTLEYSDDIWAFFQNCWHMKDWIKNDPMLPNSVKDNIEREVENYDSLMISADLTNRSKHLALTKNIRRDARISGIGGIIHAPPIVIHERLYSGEAPPEKADLPREIGFAEHPFFIETSDGKKVDGLSIAGQAVDDWKIIFQKFSLPWT